MTLQGNTTVWAAACVLMVSAAALADTVVMESGKTYTGRAEPRGDVVRIEMDHGTIEVPADEVAYIIPSKADEESAGDKPSADERPGDSGSGDAASPRVPAGATDARRPEPMLFMLMRRLQHTPAGSESYNLRRQIRTYRIMSHERKRKVGGRWVDPDYFKRARKAFAETLDEAEQLHEQADRVRGDTPGDEAERRRLRQQASTKYRSAARQWPDPLLRKFLLGIAELYAGNYKRADPLFADCISEMPQLAGFHQGRALALQGLRRHGEALSAAMKALRLQPESPQALALVVDAMENVPGSETDRPPFTDAREMLKDYQDVDETVSRARRKVRWMMPGLRRDWNVRSEKSMPELPYDRLYVRQAVAVPVGEQFVLVDAEAVDGAEEVFVQTSDGRLFGGEPARVSTFGRQGSLPALRVVGVPDAGFASAEVVEQLPQDTRVTAHTCGAYAEMGSDARRFETTITRNGDPLETTVALLAGQSASPLLTEDGRIAGFLAARTDPAEDNGGPNNVMPPDAIRELLNASRMRIRRGGFGFGYSVAKRNVEPQVVEDRTFVVLGIFAERFE